MTKKVERRLEGWKARLLFLRGGGRLVLVSAVCNPYVLPFSVQATCGHWKVVLGV